jgi:hypothetical protein
MGRRRTSLDAEQLNENGLGNGQLVSPPVQRQRVAVQLVQAMNTSGPINKGFFDAIATAS